MKIKLYSFVFCLMAMSSNTAIADITCRISGCNGEICESALGESMSTICEVREEYACYKTAKCERQKDGKCGWTISKELEECLNKKRTTK